MTAWRRVVMGCALSIVACMSGPSAASDPASAPSSTATRFASPTPSAGESQPATPSPGGDRDVSQFVRALVTSWRPVGPTLLLDRRPGVGQGHVIFAVPVSGGAPVDLVELPSDAVTWRMRPDGGALVVSVLSTSWARLAIVDLRTGRARWLPAQDDADVQWSPLWSVDGDYVYYGASKGFSVDAADRGILRVRADGSDRVAITDPVPPGPGSFGGQLYSSSWPERITADGLMLWYAEAGASRTLRARDLAGRSERAFVSDPPCVQLAALRVAAPSALVVHGSCQEVAAKLSLCDVRTGAQTVLVDRPIVVRGADWDRDGRRVVAAVTDTTTNTTELVVVDGRGRTRGPGTTDAGTGRWTSAGIADGTIARVP